MIDDVGEILQLARASFCYDPNTGVISWAKDTSNVKAGAPAGWQAKVYRYVGLAGFEYPAHRIIWLMVHERWPDVTVDHINGDSRDNRLCNLREATCSQNLMNARLRSDNSVGLKGVRFAKNNKSKPYRAFVSIGGAGFHLGYFPTAEAAHAAYVEAATRLFGKFARAA